MTERPTQPTAVIPHLTKANVYIAKYAELKGDPVHIAVIRESFAHRKKELLDESLYWFSEWVDANEEFVLMRAKVQLDLELEGKASTAAESTAKARTAMMKMELAKVAYLKKFYGDLLVAYQRHSNW